MFHLVITHTFVAIGSPMLSSSSWMHASRAALADIVLSLGAAEKQNSLRKRMLPRRSDVGSRGTVCSELRGGARTKKKNLVQSLEPVRRPAGRRRWRVGLLTLLLCPLLPPATCHLSP